MLIDAFTFMNEFETLWLRLNYLDPIIDKFVLVEATKTHSGNPKPLYFNENKEAYRKFWPKINHVVVNNMPEVVNGDRWALENYQRNAILIGLNDIEDDDYLMISDVDEIPNINEVAKKPYGVYDQKVFMYYYNVYSSPHWNGTVGMTYKIFKAKFNSPQAVRNNRNYMEPIRNGGWHFGWLGNYERLMYKIKAFAHTEIDIPEYVDPLQSTLDNLKPLWCPNGGPMDILPLTYENFPEYLVDNPEEFKGLIK